METVSEEKMLPEKYMVKECDGSIFDTNFTLEICKICTSKSWSPSTKATVQHREYEKKRPLPSKNLMMSPLEASKGSPRRRTTFSPPSVPVGPPDMPPNPGMGPPLPELRFTTHSISLHLLSNTILERKEAF